LNDAHEKRGRPKKGEGKPVRHRISYGTGNRAYILARLDRDRPDLAAACRPSARAGRLPR
jgi:hypothetical protein